MRTILRNSSNVCSCSSSSSSSISHFPHPRIVKQLCPPSSRFTSSGNLHLAVCCSATNEADSLYKGIPVASGIIEKRLMDKQMKKENKEFVAAMKLAEDDDRKVQLFRRESRTPPEAGDHDGLIEYFMNTVTEDMQFEVSRWRPTLNDSFFRHLDGVIGRLRFTGDASDEESSEQLVELEALRDYLVASCAAIDQAVVKMSSAKDRVAKLLSSKDKKEMILEMVAANEIDQSLMDLLQQNIQVARMAGQEDPARFMEKVLQACAKYYVAPLVAEASSLPALPGGMPMKELRLGAGSSNGAGGASSAGSSIIIPGGTIKSGVSGGVNTSTGGSKSSGLIIPGR